MLDGLAVEVALGGVTRVVIFEFPDIFKELAIIKFVILANKLASLLLFKAELFVLVWATFLFTC